MCVCVVATVGAGCRLERSCRALVRAYSPYRVAGGKVDRSQECLIVIPRNRCRPGSCNPLLSLPCWAVCAY